MTTSLIDTETILGIDVGTVNTRALLFDVVEGQYSFIAAGVAPTTLEAPYHDPAEGMIRAVRQLQEVTGRDLLEPQGRLIIPVQADGSGIDRMVVTYSTGQPLRMVVAGLLADVSLESAQRLAATTYGQVVESIGLNDRRRSESQLDAILRAGPDLVLFAGGTEGGASRSLGRMVDLMTLVCRVLPQEKRPEIIYAGNQVLSGRIKEILEKWTPVRTAPNIRPTIDVEDLGQAEGVLSQAVTRVRLRQLPGLAAMASFCSVAPLPTGYAFGRVIRYLSRVYGSSKGVLGVDLGAGSTVLAAGQAGKLNLLVSSIGMGQGAARLIEQASLENIMEWLPVHVPDEVVRDYLWQKTLHPASLPASQDSLAIEHALARVALSLARQQFQARYPNAQAQLYDPILASGATINQAATPVQSLLMLLDGLQPVGITNLVLDQNNLTPTLGAISEFLPLLPVQVLDSGAFLRLATVISPISAAKYGVPILEARLEYEGGGSDTRLEVRMGGLVALPLQQGQVAVLHLKCLRDTRVDPRSSKKNIKYKIIGGSCGAVIDGRGRPLELPPDASRRRDQLKKWAMALGG
jgi:hypothetical protein